MKIAGISGSLRQGSYNTQLLEAARRLAPEGVTLDIVDVSAVPFYHAALDGEGRPKEVQDFVESIAACDGILFATPEYNHSIPGVLKNAIDWASRPAPEMTSVLVGRPAGIVSASVSPLGGVRAQAQLRHVLVATRTPIFLAPDFVLGSARNAFDAAGVLVDEAAERRLRRYLKDFIAWVRSRPELAVDPD